MSNHTIRDGNSRNAGQQAGNQSSYDSQRDQNTEVGNWDTNGTMDMMGDEWNQMRSQIKQRWSQVTDQELMQTQGNFERLCSLIQQRTGESRQMIEQELRQMIDREPESEGSMSMGVR